MSATDHGESVQPEWDYGDWCPKCGGGYRRWSFRDRYRRSRLACLSRRCLKGEHLHRSRTCRDCGWYESVVTPTEDAHSGRDGL